MSTPINSSKTDSNSKKTYKKDENFKNSDIDSSNKTHDNKNKILSEDINKRNFEISEIKETKKVNNKNLKKKNIELNEESDELSQKYDNQNKKKKRKLVKRRDLTDSDSDNDYSNNSSLNSDENDSDSESDKSEQKEIEEYINKKKLRNNGLYNINHKKNNKKTLISDEIALLKESEFKTRKKDKIKEKDQKQTKKLKKTSENKEMKLSLDTECTICCDNIIELANPDGCNHDFCKECLFDWTQKSTKCPICKKEYNSIFIYDKGIKKQLTINEVREMDLDENSNEEEESEDDSEDICYICGKSNEPESLLICDKCESIFCHYYCAKLDKIPEKKWYCEYCLEKIKANRGQKRRVGNFIM